MAREFLQATKKTKFFLKPQLLNIFDKQTNKHAKELMHYFP